MNRLQAITTIRALHAPDVVDDAVEAVRDWVNKWGHTLEPEELEHTREILGGLLEIQANAVLRATRRGETMSIRLTELERGEVASDLEIAA